MGATTFEDHGSGDSADDAFRKLHKQACYDYGHAGYTGTIAEKDSFVVIGEEASLDAAYERISALYKAEDERIVDKWGPAGCIHITGTDIYVFFGWAST